MNIIAIKKICHSIRNYLKFNDNKICYKALFVMEEDAWIPTHKIN